MAQKQRKSHDVKTRFTLVLDDEAGTFEGSGRLHHTIEYLAAGDQWIEGLKEVKFTMESDLPADTRLKYGRLTVASPCEDLDHNSWTVWVNGRELVRSGG